MLRTIRAFGWLRWRVLVNSLERTGARDTVERVSVAIEKLGPVIAALLMIPSAVMAGVLGTAAGFAIAGGERSVLFEVVRYVLLVVPVLCVAGPLFLPAADRTNAVRILLLPISRSTLYVAQTGATLADPWNLLILPMVLGVSIGLAAGGAGHAAIVALAGAVLLGLVLAGVSSLATSVIHLVARDRRRGEFLAFIFIVVLPVVALMPGAIEGARERHDGSRPAGTEHTERLPPWVKQAATQAFALLPTELYARAARESSRGLVGPGWTALAGLGLIACLLHALGMRAFWRVLDSPGSTGRRRAGSLGRSWEHGLPLLSRPSSAVALAHLRLAMRTPRGRGILLTPLLMFGVFSVIMLRNGGTAQFGSLAFESGLALATFACSAALLSILPIAMNQFAVDRAGVTLVLLSPLTTRDYLTGKAVGNGLIAAIPVVVCVIIAAIALPAAPLALWLTLLLGLLAVYLVVSPVAAVLSAVFPRAVDMNSIGRGSNAHAAAGFIGMLAFFAAAAGPALLTLLAIRLLERPSLAPVLAGAWCVVAYVAGRLLFLIARRVFATRRENLALVR